MTDPVIQVQIMDFPCRFKETVTKNDDDTYTIFINAKLSHEAQLLCYQHALRHIVQGDFEKQDADKIEGSAHRFEASAELCH